MFAVFCLLLLLLRLGLSQDLPTRYEVESSINRTIEEVERQIRENPSLPRLSRADIVRTLRNITSQDLKQLKDKEKLEKARNLYQRALMVVLPYNAESSSDLKDLYTKPPMTQIIDDQRSENRKENRGDEEDNEVQNSEITTENFSHKTTLKDLATMNKNKYKNHKDTYSEVQTKIPLKETLKLDSTPVKFTFNLENLQKNSYSTERSTTRYPIYRSNGSTSELEVVYSTSVTEATTKPAPKEIAIDLGRFKEKQNILTSSQWRYNAPPTTFEPTLPSKVDRVPFLPTITVEPEERVTSTEKSDPIEEALIMSTEKPTTLYVTPMSAETTLKTKYSSTYSLNSAGFRQATSSSTTSMPMRPEVMDLLASIGLRPDNNSNVEDVYKKNKDILELSNIRTSTLTPVTDPAIVDEKMKVPGSEIKKGVDNLSQDVQLLFKKFGIQPPDLDKSSTTQRTTINLNSYTNFKPLPTSSVKDEELKEFLARFGLISDNRKQKSMRTTTETPSLLEVVPDNMRGILENIGLISRKRKTVVDDQDMKSTDSSKFHVFKPHEAKLQDEEQKNKINELLDTVKLMQEGKAGIQNVKQVASDLLQTTKILKEGPDPLKLEEIIKTYEEDARNEVKRQEEEEKSETTTVGDEEQTTTSATESAGETTLSPTTTTTTTDSAKAASDQLNSATGNDSSTSSNLMALEESFGGTTKAPDTSLPPRRKSGLYFLVDWNTFLEVGDDEKEKVNLRFQPKVGDRSRFLSVTVP